MMHLDSSIIFFPIKILVPLTYSSLWLACSLWAFLWYQAWFFPPWLRAHRGARERDLSSLYSHRGTAASSGPAARSVSDLLVEPVCLHLLFFQPNVNTFTADKKPLPSTSSLIIFPSGVHLAYIKELLSLSHCFINLLIFFLSIIQKTLLIEICQQEDKQAAFDMLFVWGWVDK